MACGTAVVTTRRGSPLEVCGDARSVRRRPDGRDRTHAALLGRLVEDDDYRVGFEDCGRERAEAFSWEKTANTYLQVYDDVLSQ